MKDKLKDTFLFILYLVGAFAFFSLLEGDLSDTLIGNILQVLCAIGGMAIVGFYIYVFVVTIYVAIRDYIKGKIQAEVRKEIAKQKYLEKQERK